MTKVLILGHTGQLGSMLCHTLPMCSQLGIVTGGRLDVTRDEPSKLSIESNQYVINAIGAIPQRCNDELKFLKVNTIWPKKLAGYCAEKKAKLIHVSTDCVYDGLKGNYVETDTPNSKDAYGQSKAKGEPKNAMTIRTSFIGPEINSKAYGLFEWFRNTTEEVHGWNNHIFNGVSNLEFAKVIKDIIKYDKYERGVFHVFSRDAVTKYTLLNQINTIFELHKPIISEEHSQSINRTLYTMHGLYWQCRKKTLYDQLKELASFL